MPVQFPKKITDIISIPFSIDKFGLYSITIIARCQSSKQDLKIEIDSLKFREIPSEDKPQYNNIPSSWNGTELKGLSKTIIFILRLNKGTHKLIFIPTEEAIIDEYKIIVNTTPLGMYPNINEAPLIPYNHISTQHILYDIIYNPDESLFLKNGKAQGAKIKNGKKMLILQAEASWKIWNKTSP